MYKMVLPSMCKAVELEEATFRPQEKYVALPPLIWNARDALALNAYTSIFTLYMVVKRQPVFAGH